jgi:hypothetical protein
MISQSQSSISVNMPSVTPTETGGSSIISYNLQFKENSATTYTTLIGEAPNNLVQSYTRNGLTANSIY